MVDIIETNTINYIRGIKLIESDYGVYIYNAHGDVVQLVKDNIIIARYDYSAYGQQLGE